MSRCKVRFVGSRYHEANGVYVGGLGVSIVVASVADENDYAYPEVVTLLCGPGYKIQ